VITGIIFLAVCFLAYSNGANDNFTSASLHGLPVSTTHVSVGSLLGMGLATRQVKWKPVLGVLASWIVTLPCAALLAGLAYALLRMSSP